MRRIMDNQWTTHRLAAGANTLHGDTPLSLDSLLEREWLLTNGTGSYSMGTALGCNTRRYHGLLVAASHPPVGRVLALNQVFDQLILTRGKADPEQRVELSTCRFVDEAGQPAFAPQGHQVVTEFARGITAEWTHQWGNITVTRELILHWKEPAITLRYRVSGLSKTDGSASIRVATGGASWPDANTSSWARPSRCPS